MQLSLQMLRFGIVGVASNLALYLLYLLLTNFGMGHKLAMTGIYAVGVAQTFLINKIWTFRHVGLEVQSFGRYLTLYAACYLLNLVSLLIFVDMMGMKHQIIQCVMIILIAAITFTVQKFWVFKESTTQNRGIVSDG